jgi:hypothetical protein
MMLVLTSSPGPGVLGLANVKAAQGKKIQRTEPLIFLNIDYN